MLRPKNVGCAVLAVALSCLGGGAAVAQSLNLTGEALAGASRIGTSSGVAILESYMEQQRALAADSAFVLADEPGARTLKRRNATLASQR